MCDRSPDERLDELLRQRFRLSTALASATARAKREIRQQALVIAKQLRELDEAAARGDIRSSQLTVLARELMADNIDAAAAMAQETPFHPMVAIFLRDAAQLAEHAWATRIGSAAPGPFGGLLQLSWVLRQTNQPSIGAAAPLEDAVVAARQLSVGQDLDRWDHPAVERFLVANAVAGIACGIRM